MRHGLTLQEQTPAHSRRTLAMSRSSYSSESCLLLSALTSSATRTCNLTRFSSPSRLNVIHGHHHIHISRFILHLSLSFITPMIPGSLEGQSIRTRNSRKSLPSAYPGRDSKPDFWFIDRSMYHSNHSSRSAYRFSSIEC